METKCNVVRIRNNRVCNKFPELCQVLRFMYNLVNTYKKILSLLDNFVKLLHELSQKVFCNKNNEEYSKRAIYNAINALYNDILIVCTSRSDDVQVLNISTCHRTVPGFKAYTTDRNAHIEYNIYYFIDSYRIQHYDHGSIKIVHNDNKNLPKDIMFIGTNMSKYECLNDMMQQALDNTLETVNKFKVMELYYRQKLNNLQKIID